MACGGPPQGGQVEVGAGQTVIQGVVTAAGKPVGAAYVRLLDASGEFTAEVVSSAEGQFRFFAAPGDWTIKALSPRGNGETSVKAGLGRNDTALSLPA